MVHDRARLAAPRDVAVRPDQHRAVGAEPEPLAERAVGAVEVRPDNVCGDRIRLFGRDLRRSVQPGGTARTGDQGQPLPDQVMRGHRPSRPLQRCVREPSSGRRHGREQVARCRFVDRVAGVDCRRAIDVAHVLGQAIGRAALGALRGKAEVVTADRLPLLGVRVEERGIGPAAEHPGQLPRQPEGIGDGRVQSSPAERRHAMGRIADEECAPDTHPVGGLGDELDRHPGEHLDLEVGHAGGRPDELDAALHGVVGERFAARVPLHPEHPAVVEPGRHEDAGDRAFELVEPEPLLAEQ